MKQCVTCEWGHKLSGVVLCPFVRCVKEEGFKVDEKVKEDAQQAIKTVQQDKLFQPK